jgi:hypothetical protein
MSLKAIVRSQFASFLFFGQAARDMPRPPGKEVAKNCDFLIKIFPSSGCKSPFGYVWSTPCEILVHVPARPSHSKHGPKDSLILGTLAHRCVECIPQFGTTPAHQASDFLNGYLGWGVYGYSAENACKREALLAMCPLTFPFAPQYLHSCKRASCRRGGGSHLSFRYLGKRSKTTGFSIHNRASS